MESIANKIKNQSIETSSMSNRKKSAHHNKFLSIDLGKYSIDNPNSNDKSEINMPVIGFVKKKIEICPNMSPYANPILIHQREERIRQRKILFSEYQKTKVNSFRQVSNLKFESTLKGNISHSRSKSCSFNENINPNALIVESNNLFSKNAQKALEHEVFQHTVDYIKDTNKEHNHKTPKNHLFTSKTDRCLFQNTAKLLGKNDCGNKNRASLDTCVQKTSNTCRKNNFTSLTKSNTKCSYKINLGRAATRSELSLSNFGINQRTNSLTKNDDVVCHTESTRSINNPTYATTERFEINDYRKNKNLSRSSCHFFKKNTLDETSCGGTKEDFKEEGIISNVQNTLAKHVLKDKYSFAQKKNSKMIEYLGKAAKKIDTYVEQKQKIHEKAMNIIQQNKVSNEHDAQFLIRKLITYYDQIRIDKKKPLNSSNDQNIDKKILETEECLRNINNPVFKNFLKKNFAEINLHRLKTFEKFAFTGLERETNILLKNNLTDMRGTEPKGTFQCNDLWCGKDRVESLIMSKFRDDKKNFEKYVYQSANKNPTNKSKPTDIQRIAHISSRLELWKNIEEKENKLRDRDTRKKMKHKLNVCQNDIEKILKIDDANIDGCSLCSDKDSVAIFSPKKMKEKSSKNIIFANEIYDNKRNKTKSKLTVKNEEDCVSKNYSNFSSRNSFAIKNLKSDKNVNHLHKIDTSRSHQIKTHNSESFFKRNQFLDEATLATENVNEVTKVPKNGYQKSFRDLMGDIEKETERNQKDLKKMDDLLYSNSHQGEDILELERNAVTVKNYIERPKNVEINKIHDNIKYEKSMKIVHNNMERQRI